MKPRTALEYLDSTSQILEKSAKLLAKHGHLELSAYVFGELRKAAKYDNGDALGVRAKILILAGASLLVRKYAEQNKLADVAEQLNQWDEIPSAY